jgi:putative SOS response-associated peptidase YedK
MCYDISFSTSIELITDYLPGIEIDPQITIDFDTSIHVLAQEHRKYPVIVSEDDRYKLKEFEWGIIADYMNTPEKIKKNRAWMCNAQSEKIIGDKNSYWNRIRKKRCLIPVTGFYEHREVKGWKNKVPYYIRLKGRELFCLPGLYEYSPLPDLETGELTGTFTLITKAANEVMRFIHNGGTNAFRMPLFLTHEQELKWLEHDLTDAQISEILDYEMPSEQLEYWPVYSIRTTKPRPDNKTKMEPYEWPRLPMLGKDADNGKAENASSSNPEQGRMPF